MNSYKKLFNNVIIFALGNLGSKIISFLLVPLYTHYLTQGEYGTADLVLTTVSMLIPVVSAAMHEAVLRFAIDRSSTRRNIITNSLVISLVGYSIMLLLYPIIAKVDFFGNNLIYLYVILFLQMMNQIFAQYTRGIGESKKFALNGVIISFATGILNVLFLVTFNFGLTGYFWSYILAYTISTLYLIIVIKPFKEVELSAINKDTSKKLLKYSIPLIPNSLMWWLINGSSRYFITGFIGISANGIFAVSSRIPALINLVSQIFAQAWQLSAFEELGNKENTAFYSKIFELYYGILFLTTSAFIVIMKPLFEMLFSADFYIAWEPAPFLLLGSVFSALSGIVGVAYTASKKTQGVFKTSIYGGIASVLLNLLLIPNFGVLGAGFSSMISFFIMFIVRYIDTKPLVELEIKWVKLIATIALVLFQTLILFVGMSIKIEIIITGIIFVIVLLINNQVFQMIPFLWKAITGILNKKSK